MLVRVTPMKKDATTQLIRAAENYLLARIYLAEMEKQHVSHWADIIAQYQECLERLEKAIVAAKEQR